MFILGINGSLAKESSTRKGIQAVLEVGKREGAVTVLFDLQQLPLPIYNPDKENILIDENVKRFRALLEQADAIVLGSPEYHNSVSGVFKNALDWANQRHFANKPIALVSAAGGPTSMNTLNTMQIIARSLHGWIIPTFGSISGDTHFTASGDFQDAKMKQRFDTIGLELVRLTRLIKCESVDPQVRH